MEWIFCLLLLFLIQCPLFISYYSSISNDLWKFKYLNIHNGQNYKLDVFENN